MSEETQHDHGNCVFCEVTAAMGPLLQSLGGSDEAKKHFRQSRLEFMKGVRSMLDDRIESMSSQKPAGTRVVVE